MNSGLGRANLMSAMQRPPPIADGFALRRRHAVSGARLIVPFGAASAASRINTQSVALGRPFRALPHAGALSNPHSGLASPE